ncbi:isopenicillin N synthase family dioxygenase [Streptomyces sp. NPDC057638]|uniref:isopenicillin N synthase family dioxygenase n=1 Tax=Streptomyces sp. NPDC057638 TaxID=3346190 RepID=UPI0036A66B42
MSHLPVFQLPDIPTGTPSDQALADAVLRAWRTHGILYLTLDEPLRERATAALRESRHFFGRPLHQKLRHLNDLSYSGYITVGEETTAGQADLAEIFTVCKDIAPDDQRFLSRWPCHGPVPWPDPPYQRAITAYMDGLGDLAERLLAYVALGLGLGDPSAFRALTDDGWHHLRALRFPTASRISGRGIGSHTDYGLVVLAAQDDTGGLWVRPPVPGECRNRNWLERESAAGMYENEGPWTYVPPVEGTVTAFPGDILQLLTCGELLSTPHKVRLTDRERYSMAYFHEPNFQAWVEPLLTSPQSAGESPDEERLHYGSHFTRMMMRSYPARTTTRRIREEGGLVRLARLREGAGPR